MAAVEAVYSFESVFGLYNKIQNMLHFNFSLMHIIDIRKQEEYNKSHIKNAVNVPMVSSSDKELRNRL